MPCQHNDEINQLEVHVVSKRNELASLMKQLTQEQRSGQGELQKQYTKLEMYRQECKKIRSQSLYTEANVVGIEKINELKGKLIDLENNQTNL